MTKIPKDANVTVAIDGNGNLVTKVTRPVRMWVKVRGKDAFKLNPKLKRDYPELFEKKKKQ